jgi:membrane-associated phospholipid phosphatase
MAREPFDRPIAHCRNEPMSATPIPVALHAASRQALVTLWRRACFTDRQYIAYFAGLGLLIAVLRDRVDGWPALLALHAAGLGFIAATVTAAARIPAVHAWYPLLMPLVTFPEIAALNLLLVDGWRDAPLVAFEASLFPEPPIVWLRRVTPWIVAELFQAGYLSYFLFLVTVAGLLRRRGEAAAFRGVIAASVLAYLACYVVFLAYPMEGPAHTLRHLSLPPVAGGPLHEVVRLVQQAGVHGNAFPSAHVAGAVPPLVFACRHAPRLGAILAVLIVLMGFGAVYDGYHYASDIVAGLVAGGIAAAAVLAVQRSPAWSRRLNLPVASPARS